MKRTLIRRYNGLRKRSNSLRNKAWTACSMYIRTRDAILTTNTIDYVMCFTCGVYRPIKRMHAGHFIDGRHNATLFDEFNIHAQCPMCNYYEHGNQRIYRKRMIDKYGTNFVDALEERSRHTKTFYGFEYDEMIKRFNRLTKEMKETGKLPEEVKKALQCDMRGDSERTFTTPNISQSSGGR